MVQTDASNTLNDAIRTIFSVFDRLAYLLLGLMYQIFFNVASADLFNNATILEFYKRIQLIIGVFMIFQLAIIILKGIMNPDQVMDAKSGAGAFIKRVIIALALLTILTPINIPDPQNEYEKQLNNNGLLFGTLYSLQYRILNNNTLGRLILGTDDGGMVTTNEDGTNSEQVQSSNQKIKEAADVFTATLLKGFIRINLHPDWEEVYEDNGKPPETQNACRMCQDIPENTLYAYTKLDASTDEILSVLNADCTPEGDWLNEGIEAEKTSFWQKITGKKKYAFTYVALLPALIALVFAYILLVFTIEVAVRAIKLVVLRLLAPIPIISYMDPNGGKDNAFNSWVKMLTSTYLDLFIRLAVIYFIIFLIQDMIVNGIVIETGTGLIGILSFIMICIGLFMFAKEFPKFVREMLGMKGDGGGIFKGIGSMLGVGAAGLGMIGSARANWRAAKEENEALHQGQTKRNFMRNVGSAIAGGIAGGATGLAAAAGAKDHAVSAAIKAQQQRNATRASHSTATGRAYSSLYGLATGQSLAKKSQNKLEYNNKAFDALKKYKGILEDEAVKQKTDFYGKDKTYNRSYNYSSLEAALSRARGSGQATFDYDDGVNSYQGLRTDFFDSNVMNDIKSSQAQEYSDAIIHGKKDANGNVYTNGTVMNQYKTTKQAVEYAEIEGFDGTYSTTKPSMGAAKDAATAAETDMRTIMRRADEQNKK